MRVDPNLYTKINAAIEQSQQSLQSASTQLSSGKSVSLPSDNPLAFAQNVQSLASSAAVDQYTRNADSVLMQAQNADAALSNVITSLTQAVSLGTEGANGTLTGAQRTGVAQQVQGLLSNVLAQANLTTDGTALFAGTANTTTPFVADSHSPGGFTYQGNGSVNQAQVGAGLQVTVNVPGDQIFTSPNENVLGSLQQMITALQSGTTDEIATAISNVSAAISHVSQIRVVYGTTVSSLNAQNNYLAQETVSLSSQQSSLTKIDLATAATNLTQAETESSAVLAMAAKILPTSLLNYLK